MKLLLAQDDIKVNVTEIGSHSLLSCVAENRHSEVM